MDRLTTLIESSDLCSTAFLLLLLIGIGSRLVFSLPGALRAGQILAVAVFLLYALADVSRCGPVTADQWVIMLVRSLTAGGIALGVSWMFLAVLAFLYRLLFARPVRAARDSVQTRRDRRIEWRRRREAERERRREQREFVLRAPERERAQRQAEADAQARAVSQQRREDARAGALLHFSYYAAKLGDRFTRAMFDEYITAFMGDRHPVEVVERRGRDLLAILKLHLADVQPPRREASFESIAAWHRDELERIDALPLEDAVKSYCRVSLNRRLQDLLKEHLRVTAP